MVYGVIGSACFAVGTIGNLITLTYFVTKTNRSISTLLYVCISLTDTIISILILSVGISNFMGGDPGLFSNKLYCNIWGLVWNIAARMSVFLVGVLSISRTISLIYPLRKISRKHIIIPCVIYFVILIIQSTIPYWYGVQYRYDKNIHSCTWYFTDIFDRYSMEHKILYFVLVLLEYVIPAIPIISSCLISVYILRRSISTVGQTNTGKIKINATVTIILLTIAYIVFNVPSCIYYSLWSISIFTNYTFPWYSNMSTITLIILRASLELHYIALNSIANAILYFCRIQKLREHVLRIIKLIICYDKGANDTNRTQSETYILSGKYGATKGNRS